MAKSLDGPAKRSKRDDADDDDDHGNAASVSKSDLDEMFAGFKEDIVKQMQTTVDSGLERMVRQYDKTVQKRLSFIERDINEGKERQHKFEASQAAIKSQLDALSKDLGRVEQTAIATPKDINEDEFDRTPDAALLRINAESDINKVAVTEALQGWLDESCKGEYLLQGPDVAASRNFSFKFQGLPLVAARKANQALRSLRNCNGEWKSFSAKRSDGNLIRLYISEDKLPRQLRTERAGKKLVKILRAQCPGKSYSLNRREGTINCNWKPIVRVRPQPAGECIIEWNNAALEDNFDKNSVAVAFREDGTDTKVEWSC